MKKYPQLTRLICDYYRENGSEIKQLEILGHCKVNRRWGSFRINCPDQETAEAIMPLISLLQVPILKLNLAKRIKLLVKGRLIKTIQVPATQLARFEIQTSFNNQ